MCRCFSVRLLSLILAISLAGSVGAACLEGDLSGDCAVGFEDVWRLAEDWLDPAGSPADLIGNNGVDMADFAVMAKNWGKRRSPVVINEIHYDPDVKTELVEFIELHNISEVDVNIAGWYFSDGITYQFPAGAMLPAGGYVVAAQTPSQVVSKFGVSPDIVYGPWVGGLSNEGEQIVLRDRDRQKVDEVDYGEGFPWPTVGDIPGYSIELVNPDLDNDLGGSWRASVPADAPLPPATLIPAGARWRYFKGYSEASDPNHSAWQEIGFNDSGWGQINMIIGYGPDFPYEEPLTDMRYNYSSVYLRKTFEIDDPSTVTSLVLKARFDDGFNAYINGTHVRRSSPDLVSADELPYTGTTTGSIEDLNWHTFDDLPDPRSYLEAGTNVLAMHLYNSSIDRSTDCWLDVQLEQTYSRSGATPGRRNNAYDTNTPPLMRQVEHDPEQPRSGEDVKITVKVTDDDGVQSVKLAYQRVNPGSYIPLKFLETDGQRNPAYDAPANWTEVSMRDDGLAGDAEAGDDTYSVVLPGSLQVHRRLVRYRITAKDQTGLEITGPYNDDPQPNFAYFVYDGVPAWSGAIQPGSSDPVKKQVITYNTQALTRIPVYHLISRSQDVADGLHMPPSTNKYLGDSYLWYGTLVYDGKVYDHIRYRARGGVWRYSMGKNMWKFDFNRGHWFQARDDFGKKYDVEWTKVNFSACIQQGNYWHRGEQGMFEAAGFKLFNLMGAEASKTSWVHFRLIDGAAEAGPTQYDGDFFGLYMNIEQLDGRFLDEHKLPDGNLYKIEGHNAESNNQGPTAVTDRSDFDEFKNRGGDGYGYYQDPNPTEQWWRNNVDLQRYYGYRCVVEGIHHGDIAYGKNWFFYLNPQSNIWSMHCWDLDLTWANNMYGNGEDVFKNEGAIFSNSVLLIEYNNRLREFRDLLYNAEQMNPLLDELANIIDNPADTYSMVDADRAMWDYNPLLNPSSGYVDSDKGGQGRFYQQAATKDFRGMVQIMKNYVVGSRAFNTYSEDPAAPYTPTVTYQGPAGYPINALVFRTSNFSDPQGSGTFAAMKWRIAEVTDLTNPRYEPGDPRKYEIEAVWEGNDLTVFRPDMQIPGIVVDIGRSYRVRCKMKDTSGRWSHWSSPIQFIVGVPVAAHVLDDLRITEVMYNPADADVSKGELDVDSDEFEFIELKNIGGDVLDLTYVSFVQGITFNFYGSSVTSLGPGQFVLVVRNKAAFESRYGVGLSGRIAGQYMDYDTKLDNTGETVQLVDTWNGTIALFTYSDDRGWPLPADGSGHSLVPLSSAIAGEPNGSLDYGDNWRHSAYLGGSPGADDPELPRTVVLNEVMAHTDYSDPAHPEYDSDDWIELYNTGGTGVNLGGWYLSDDKDDLKKWAIPSVNIGVGGRISFDEVTGFHNPITSGFGLDKAGEEVLLSFLPGTSQDRVVDYVRFKGEENFISLARYPDGGLYWLHTPASRDLPNNGGVVDIVVDELMYHHVDPNEEYIELYNPTGGRIYLENADGSWRLDGAVDYVFASGAYINAGARLIVVGFDPATEWVRLIAFISAYGTGPLTPGVDIVGPWSGVLANEGERLALKRPQAADLPLEPLSWVVVDEVIYFYGAPWPASADGLGDALQRNYADGRHSGNDPANWRANSPTPGRSP